MQLAAFEIKRNQPPSPFCSNERVLVTDIPRIGSVYECRLKSLSYYCAFLSETGTFQFRVIFTILASLLTSPLTFIIVNGI